MVTHNHIYCLPLIMVIYDLFIMFLYIISIIIMYGVWGFVMCYVVRGIANFMRWQECVHGWCELYPLRLLFRRVHALT